MSRSSVEGRVLADLAAVTYRIDPSRSGISFTTGHLFGLGRVTGTFDLTDGEIQVAHPIELSQVTVVDRVHGGGAELSLHGRARIDRYAFGITAARGMAGRFLDVALQVTAFTDDVLDVR